LDFGIKSQTKVVPGTADRSTSDLLRNAVFEMSSRRFRESSALFFIVDLFTAFRMFIRLEKEPPLGSRSGLASLLEGPEEESSMDICCFMYFL
jgi:hypothetical protein